MDAGARLLLRQVSYGALMATYLDQNVKSEEKRKETIKHISDLFQAMADTTSRIIVSSVAARKSLYLKDLAFKSKATENKLLNTSTMGPKIFGGKFFESVQESAQNLRDAKEIQYTRYRAPTSEKRKRDTYDQKSLPQRDTKRARLESPEKPAVRKVYFSNPPRGRSFPKKPRFQKGTGFQDPSHQRQQQ